jgi:tetratricopeptide (TPR) repeat protein
MKTKLIAITALLLICASFSCKKDFLDKKPDKALLVPVTLSDFQALLDNADVMNVSPFLNMLSADDYYSTDAGLASAFYYIQTSYIWAKDIYQGNSVFDWNTSYQQVFYANIVLDGLRKIKPDAASAVQYNQIKADALFIRSMAFYQLAQEFAVPYNPSSANNDLGIPLRLNSDVNEKSSRGTLQETYDQIIKDLLSAAELSPLTVSYKTHSSKPAVSGLLARVYQTMQQYDRAKNHASSCLKMYNKLIDYNTLNLAAAKPFPFDLPNANDEVIFHDNLISVRFLTAPSVTFIDSTLYATYENNDLRKFAFFANKGNNRFVFKGTYTGATSVFTGIATDEIYLIRAECHARSGNIDSALADLNTLLQKRYKIGSFTPRTAANKDDALSQVLTERRKELVYRNLRWTDLRRLNQDPGLAITLKRTYNGTVYTLPPNDPKYTFPIPDDEIRSSGIEQNIR